MSTPISDIVAVSSSALIGSPFFVVTENTLRNGMTPSEAIAWSSLGAPVGDDHVVQAFYVKKRPFTEQIATEAFSTGFGLVRYPL